MALTVSQKCMKHLIQTSTALTMLFGFCLVARGQVLVNDTWAGGSRSVQNLPSQSAWFAASAGTLTASAGAGSSLWLTYFTPSGSPATLGIGDSLRATLVFTPTAVATAPTTSRGFRLGLYDYSASTRVNADGFSTTGANGTGVTGYMLNMNFAQTFTTASPLQLMERTNIASSNLMGATGDYASLGSGGGLSGDPGFTDGRSYTLQLSVTRTAADSVSIAAQILGNTSPIQFTATDPSGASFAFDALAIRPANAASSAGQFVFNSFKAELQPVPEPASLSLLGLAATAVLAHRRSTRLKR